MTILLLSGDLMFASRVAGAAARLGATLDTIASPEALSNRLACVEPGALIVVDLTARGFDPGKWVPQFRAATNPPRAIVAYGPHVHDALLTAAGEAGCDRVFSRGEFNARMDEILSAG